MRGRRGNGHKVAVTNRGTCVWWAVVFIACWGGRVGVEGCSCTIREGSILTLNAQGPLFVGVVKADSNGTGSMIEVDIPLAGDVKAGSVLPIPCSGKVGFEGYCVRKCGKPGARLIENLGDNTCSAVLIRIGPNSWYDWRREEVKVLARETGHPLGVIEGRCRGPEEEAKTRACDCHPVGTCPEQYSCKVMQDGVCRRNCKGVADAETCKADSAHCEWEPGKGVCQERKCHALSEDECWIRDDCMVSLRSRNCSVRPCNRFKSVALCPSERCLVIEGKCEQRHCVDISTQKVCEDRRSTCVWKGNALGCRLNKCPELSGSPSNCTAATQCQWSEDRSSCFWKTCRAIEVPHACPLDRCAREGRGCYEFGCHNIPTEDACTPSTQGCVWWGAAQSCQPSCTQRKEISTCIAVPYCVWDTSVGRCLANAAANPDNFDCSAHRTSEGCAASDPFCRWTTEGVGGCRPTACHEHSTNATACLLRGPCEMLYSLERCVRKPCRRYPASSCPQDRCCLNRGDCTSKQCPEIDSREVCELPGEHPHCRWTEGLGCGYLACSEYIEDLDCELAGYCTWREGVCEAEKCGQLSSRSCGAVAGCVREKWSCITLEEQQRRLASERNLEDAKAAVVTCLTGLFLVVGIVVWFRLRILIRGRA